MCLVNAAVPVSSDVVSTVTSSEPVLAALSSVTVPVVLLKRPRLVDVPKWAISHDGERVARVERVGGRFGVGGGGEAEGGHDGQQGKLVHGRTPAGQERRNESVPALTRTTGCRPVRGLRKSI